MCQSENESDRHHMLTSPEGYITPLSLFGSILLLLICPDGNPTIITSLITFTSVFPHSLPRLIHYNLSLWLQHTVLLTLTSFDLPLSPLSFPKDSSEEEEPCVQSSKDSEKWGLVCYQASTSGKQWTKYTVFVCHQSLSWTSHVTTMLKIFYNAGLRFGWQDPWLVNPISHFVDSF